MRSTAWGRGAVAASLVLVGGPWLAGCGDEMKPPYLPPEEFARLAAEDCAAMRCEGPQVDVAHLQGELDRIAAIDVVAPLAAACSALAAAAGVTIDEVEHEAPDARADRTCEAAAQHLQTVYGSPLGAGQPAVCGAALADVVACETSCACDITCPARTSTPSCDGALFGACDACTGTCSPKDPGGAVACDGVCEGRCEGECSGDVRPDGSCTGRCTGRCGGACKARSGEALDCEGWCEGCEGEVGEAWCASPPRSTGWSPHDADAACGACSARCALVAAADGPCAATFLGRSDVPADVAAAAAAADLACAKVSRHQWLIDGLIEETWRIEEQAWPRGTGDLCLTGELMRLDEVRTRVDDGCRAVRALSF